MNGVELAQQLQEASKPTELPPTPSFEPWLVRIRTIRAATTSSVMLVATLGMAMAGNTWVDAVIGGMVAAIVAFFIAWASALWICSEMYAGEVKRARIAWADRERERQQQIRDLYRQRMDMLHGTGVIDDDQLDSLMDLSPPPANPEADLDNLIRPDAWRQQAA